MLVMVMCMPLICCRFFFINVSYTDRLPRKSFLLQQFCCWHAILPSLYCFTDVDEAVDMATHTHTHTEENVDPAQLVRVVTRGVLLN